MSRPLVWVGSVCALSVALVATLVLFWWPRQFENALSEESFEEAEAALDKLTWFGRDDADQRLRLAGSYAFYGNLAEAEKQLERSLEMRPTAPGWDALGLLRTSLEDWEGVIEAYDGSRANEGGRVLISPAARAWTELGAPEKAFELMDTASREHPESRTLHSELAVLAVSLGDPARAVAFYEQLLRIDPDVDHAANNLAWLLATEDSLRDPERAVALAERALRGDQAENANYLETLAVAQAAAGRSEEALRTAERAAELAAAEGDGELRGRLLEWIERHRAR